MGVYTLTKVGANTINAYGLTVIGAGTIAINTGIIQLQSGACNASGTAFVLANAAGVALNLNKQNASIGSLAGGGAAGGNVSLGASSGTAGTLTVGGDNSSTTFAGVITQTSATSGGVAKTGNGTLTLSGKNTYTGSTIVNGGTLLANTPGPTDSATGTSAVQVNNTGTLGGTGRIAGNVTFALGAQAVFTKGSPLTITGSIVLNNNTVHLNLPANLAAGTYPLATYNQTGSSGSFAATPLIDSGSLASGNQATITTAAGTVNLVIQSANTPPVITTQTITMGAQSGVKQTLQIIGNAKYPITDAENDLLTLSSVYYAGVNATVITNGNNVEYTPLSTFTGNDSFTYTVSDGHGGIATGTVNVVVTAVSGQQTPIITFSGSDIALQFWGIPGTAYTIQRSTDGMATWQDLIPTVQASSTAPTVGQILYTNTPPATGSGFYRLKP